MALNSHACPWLLRQCDERLALAQQLKLVLPVSPLFLRQHWHLCTRCATQFTS